ncbi:glycerophosphodiester phosphodiesterase [Alteribacter natronophilus]|uniref:glycerophosphodiester phosphodiesterase n=1 Tax=Alteribacter natronophilus TaxID=2583810 RepID=UPI00110D2EC2|nr:glycerophosphodiester phosphodiesterase [Alteribacter natronophilus]TMW73359.1 glycerophosphodiester phosphodiesterase [Alteribacter natronophilus]
MGERKNTFKKRGRRVLYFLFAILSVWFLIWLFPAGERETKPFFEGLDRPAVIAHQGGEHLAPSNTLEAFENADRLGVDVIEFDVHVTSDGVPVAIHDSTVDRTTDGSGKVNDLTLEDIQSLDAGYYFRDLEGEHSFRDQGVIIPSVEEIFQAFGHMKMNIELKATNDRDRYEELVQSVWELIAEYGMENNVLVASFEQDLIDSFQELSGGAAVSGGRQEVTRFVVFHKLFLNSLYTPQVDAVQIPVEESIFNLADRSLIRGAHQRGMDVHYWTINDQETMQKLIDLGADGIITDRPDLLLELLER